MPLAVGQIECLAVDGRIPIDEPFETARQAGDGVVHVSEVERLLLAKHGQWTALPNSLPKDPDRSLQAREIVVEAAIDVAEADRGERHAVAPPVGRGQGLA